MPRKVIVASMMTLLAVVGTESSVAGQLPSACQWVPQEAIFALEVTRPKDVLDLVLAPRMAQFVTSLPGYRKQAAKPGFRQFVQVVRYLESRLGTDWKTGLRTLVGDGMTIAVFPDGGAVVTIDTKDARMLRELRDTILGFARSDAAERGEAEQIRSTEYRGVTVWSVGADQAHCIIGNRLIVANRLSTLRAVVDLKADRGRGGLAALPAYQQACAAVDGKAAVVALINLAAIQRYPSVHSALDKGRNPLATLLFAGVMEVVQKSQWLALGLHVHRDRLVLQAAVDGKVTRPAGPVGFVWPLTTDAGALPNLAVPRRVAALSLHRDLHSFYAAKDKLFPERTSGLIFFENMMGIFFSGRDLTEDVLAQATPEIRVVVARQEYDPKIGTPQVQLPSFAVVFRLRDAESFDEVAEEAWQKALGLINFTRGQQALPGLILDRPVYHGTQFTIAHFAVPTGDKPSMGVRFNFRPALVTLGDYLVLSSTESLARDLIDTLKKEAAGAVRTLAGVDSLATLDGVQLATLLRANRGHLVRQNMIEKGNTQDEAESSIEVLLALVQMLGRTKLDVACRDGRPQARLEVNLNLGAARK